MSNSYSVEAYLRATGADQFSRSFQNAGRDVEGLGKKSSAASGTIGGLIKTMAGVAAAVGAVRLLTTSLDGAITRYDTLNTFPRVLELMGFDASSSTKAVDKLSSGIEGLPTTLDEVARTTQRIAGMTGDLDGAVDTTLALNNAFLASGSSVGDVSRGLTQYVQMLSKGEVDLMSWRTLQETMPLALMRTADAFGFAGRSAQSDLYDALKAGDISFDQFNNKLIELSTTTGGFADLAVESSSGIRTSWTNMKTAVVRNLADLMRAVDMALGGVGSIAGIIDQMKVAIQAAFQYVIANVPKVFSVLQQVTEAIRPWLPLIAGVVVAFLTFNTIVAVIAKVKMAVTGLKVSFAAMNVVMMANPIGLVIAILAGLATMFVLLYKNSETFRNAVNTAFTALKEIVSTVVQYVVDFAVSTYGSLVEFFQTTSAQIVAGATAAWSAVSAFFQGIWSSITEVFNTSLNFIKGLVSRILNSEMVQEFLITFNFYKSMFTSAWTSITGIVSEKLSALREIITAILSAVSNLITEKLNTIKNVFEFIWSTIISLVQPKVDKMKSDVSSAMESIREVVSRVMEVVRTIITVVIDGVKTVFQIGFEALKTFTSQGVENIKSVIEIAFNAIKTYFSSVWEIIKGVFVAAMMFLRGDVSGGMNRLRETVQTVMSNISSFFSSSWKTIKDLVTSTLSTLLSVATSSLSSIRNFVSSSLSTIRSVFASNFSAVRSLVNAAMSFIKSTILNGVTAALSSVTSKLNAIRNVFTNIFNALRNVVSSAFNNVRSAIQSGMSTALSVITGFMSRFTTAGRNIVTSIANGIKGAVGKVTGAISSVTQKIRDFLPFSPAKEGALRDIMDVQVGESIAKAIDNGQRAAANAMASLANAVENEMPNANIAMDIGAAHKSSQRQMNYDYHNELTIAKQPAYITLDLGGRSYRTFIEDITDAQKRKTNLEVRYGGD